MPPGNGPRHLVFISPSEKSTRALLYLIEEIRSTIAVFEVEYPSAKSPDLSLKALQTEVSTLPPDYTDQCVPFLRLASRPGCSMCFCNPSSSR